MCQLFMAPVTKGMTNMEKQKLIRRSNKKILNVCQLVMAPVTKGMTSMEKQKLIRRSVMVISWL